MMLYITLAVVVIVGTWAAIVSYRSMREDERANQRLIDGLAPLSDDWKTR